MFNARTLKPQNQYKQLETALPHQFGGNVEILKSPGNCYRFCFKSEPSAKLVLFDSCLIIGADKVIISVYTAPAKRRLGLAKQLLAVAKVTLPYVYHSQHLTTLGEAWRDSVEK